MKGIVGLIFLVLILAPRVFAQDAGEWLLEEMISSYGETSEKAPDEEEVTSWIHQGRKININRMTQDDLNHLPFLTAAQAKNMMEYLNQYGEVFSIYELQAVAEFDSVTILKLLPYIEIGPPPPTVRITPGNLIRKGRHELLLRYEQVLQRQKGYQEHDTGQSSEQESLYLGSPQRYYFRYRYTFSDRIMIGLSGEKDAGEEFFNESQPLGMDFYSGFLAIGNLRWLKQLIIGNFRASFGQGLTLGGNSFGSSVSFGTAMQYRMGFIPSQSVCEYGYLRGVAASFTAGHFTWDAFYSSVRKDAMVSFSDSAMSDDPFFSSFTETGYHRTVSEIDRKNRIREQVYGGHVSYRGGRFVVGLAGFYGRWDGVLQPRQEPFRRFELQGARFGGAGLDGRLRIGFAQIFGEFGVSLNGGTAWLIGLTAIPLQGVDLLFILRHYQPEYQNPLATALSQNTSTNNEQGIFLRLQMQLLPKISITGYADLFRFPWLRYQVNAPSEGFEAGLLGLWQASPYCSCSLRYGIKKGEANASQGEDPIITLKEETRNDMKAEVNLSPLRGLLLKSCFAVKSFRISGQPREWGYLGGQDLSVIFSGIFRMIRLHYALFDIPAYSTRIYQYEPDLLYSFSAPAYYGKGYRMVLILQAEMFKRINLSGWIGMSKFTDRSVIGSGLDEIQGSLKAEVKVQVRIKL